MAALGQSVNWGDNRTDFDRYVEALIVAMWSGQPGIEVQAVNGRGGDKGLDVYVERDGVVVHIYQLKFFPGGMSGGRVKRRQQVKDSFERVADREGLEEWTLVMPENPAGPEEVFVESLRGDRTIGMHIMGQAKLDVEIAKHPSVLGWATRDPSLEWLRQARHEKDALSGPKDLDERAMDLFALGATQSPFWGWRVTGDGENYSKMLFAKRPDAAQKEPISITIGMRFEAEHEEMRQKFTRAMDFGTTSALQLPAAVVETWKVNGPEWIAEDLSNVEVGIEPVKLAEPLPSEVRTVRPDGTVISSLSGLVDLASPGALGGTIQSVFGPLTLAFRVPNDGNAGGVEISYDVRGVSATVARRMTRFVESMKTGASVELFISSERAIKTDGVEAPLNEDRNPLPNDLFALIDDLAVLEAAYEVELPVNPTITANERLDIRVARLLTEGKATVWPRIRSLDFKLSGVRVDAFEELARDGGAIFANNPKFEMTIYGRPLTLGTLAVYHPAMKLNNGVEALARLEAGTAENLPVSLLPTDDSPFRIFIQERWTDPNRPLVPEPWDVEGIAEHPGLGPLLDSLTDEA